MNLRKPHRGDSPPQTWKQLKPLARQKRHQPTPAEQRLWEALRNRRASRMKFRRQYAIERFIVDFCCVEAQLIVEVDGPIHDYTAEGDAMRQEFIESLGFRFVRVANEDVLTRLDEVVAEISRSA